MADINDIIHLLRRTEFIARPARVAELTPLSLEAAVDNILDTAPNQPVNQPVYVHDNTVNYAQRLQLHDWWIDRMATAPRPFQEKMTLFWHGHFVTEWNTTERTDFMAQNIALYRTHALGMFRPFTHAMAKDTQMMWYLSNRSNVKGTPNENFGRELLELFTLGVGNYTEEDVLSCARAWTGHNLNSSNQYTFYSTRHDTGMKTFFGVTRNWDGPEIIDEILLNNASKRLVSAQLIARKLWEFLAYQNPAQNIVDALAAEFVASDLNIRTLCRAILLRPEFYTTQSRQGLVRSPVEYSVAIRAHSGVPARSLWIFDWSLQMGQRLLDPPNVAGWKQNAYYLSTSALSARANVAKRAASQIRTGGNFDALKTATPAVAVDTVANYFGLSLAPSTRTALINGFTAETKAVGGSASTAVTNLFTATLLTGEMNAPT